MAGGDMVCPSCGGISGEEDAFCRQCGAARVPGAAPESIERGRVPPLWEDRGGTGAIRALTLTAQEVLFSPARFFRSMTVNAGLTEPLLFALLTGMTGVIFSAVWQALIDVNLQGILPAGIDLQRSRSIGGAEAAVAAAFVPFLFIAMVFLVSGIVHVLLLAVRGAANGFEATFRVVAYSACTFLLQAVPFCGSILWPFWSMTLLIIGLRDAHGISGGRAAFAVLLPLLTCCAVIALLAALFMGAFVASFGVLQR